MFLRRRTKRRLVIVLAALAILTSMFLVSAQAGWVYTTSPRCTWWFWC